ncbi:MAG TPA: hypothetical protein H9887_01095 [Candidatus Dorea intestinavium]|nr:hypothetical protein [Candidatus Dorea intestinavium]
MKAGLKEVWRRHKRKIVNTLVLLVAIMAISVYSIVLFRAENVIASTKEEVLNRQDVSIQKISIPEDKRTETKKSDEVIEKEEIKKIETVKETANSEVITEKEINNNVEEKLAKEKNRENGKDTSETPQNSNSANSGSQTNTSSNKENTVNKPMEVEKVWVEPVYKTVNHPAEYKTETYVVKEAWIENVNKGTLVHCYCGNIFNSTLEWGNHSQESGRESGCHGYSTKPYFEIINHPAQIESKQVLVKEAWDEQVLVSAGYWK